MSITLREIVADNDEAVVALRTTPAQERFVSTVASIAGAVPTGTHGSGTGNGTLAAAVSAVPRTS